IITNYLTNAYVYGRAPFEVQATTTGGRTRIVVKDQGEGVPVEFEKSLFGKFARADKKAMGGTGLGLSIVKGLAEAAGGNAWYRPNTPRGAAFAVELPSQAA
ncbi:MAG: sensor histidine kinase, partial [Actinomycetota bacterium]